MFFLLCEDKSRRIYVVIRNATHHMRQLNPTHLILAQLIQVLCLWHK